MVGLRGNVIILTAGAAVATTSLSPVECAAPIGIRAWVRGIAEIPAGGDIAMRGFAAVVLQAPCSVEHVPCCEDGVADGPVVLRAAFVVEV